MIEPHDENTFMHNEPIPPDSGKFHMTSIFIRRAIKWNSFDPDIHCIGSYIIWKRFDTKKYNLPISLMMQKIFPVQKRLLVYGEGNGQGMRSALKRQEESDREIEGKVIVDKIGKEKSQGRKQEQ